MTLSDDEIRRAILNDDSDVRAEFVAVFGAQVDPIVRQAGVVHRELARMEHIQRSERTNLVYAYVHAALNNVCSSTALLVAGYPLASGHLMRHYGECVAMALLIMDEGSGVLEALSEHPEDFRVSSSLSRLEEPNTAERLRSLLGFDAEAWRSFKKHTSFYHNFSHASLFSLFYHLEPGEPGRLIIGARFDPEKKDYTSKELTARHSALVSLHDLVEAACRLALPQPPAAPAV
jgi:hypothetical protein